MKKRTRRATDREKLTVDVKLDTTTPGAVYVQFRRGLKVARTHVRQSWPLVAVDVAEDGRVIGIEAVGHASIQLQALFEVAKVDVPARATRNARIFPGAGAQETNSSSPAQVR